MIPTFFLIASRRKVPVGACSTLFMTTGISGLVYSLSEIFNWLRFSRRHPQQPKINVTGEVEDAEIVD